MDDLFDILIESGGKVVLTHRTNPEYCVQYEQVLNILVSNAQEMAMQAAPF